MPARLAPMILLCALGLGACAPSGPAPATDRIERGTALPPPGLATPVRN
jgi:hypothetical protein